MALGILIVGLVVTLCEGGEILTTCDLVGLNLCAWKLGQNISKEYDGELSAMPSPEQVALLCRFRPEYKMCYQGKVSGCGLNLVYLSTLGTTQNTADFLCGEGNSDLLRHSSCWEKPLVRNTTNQCNKDYASSAQKLLNQNNNHVMTNTETTEWCSIINISSVCMYDTVLENCDLDAASFVVTMMQKAMTKFTSFLKCHGEESSLPVSEISTADNTSVITRRSPGKLSSSAGSTQDIPNNGAAEAGWFSGGFFVTIFIAYIYLQECCALKLS